MSNKEEINLALSDYIKLLRFKNKISQEEIASRLKITRQCYQNWEKEPIKLDLNQLIDIGNVMKENILIFFKEQVAMCNKEDFKE